MFSFGTQAACSAGRFSSRLMAALAFLIISGLLPSAVAAQTGGIRGFVVDPVGRPINGAIVRALSGPSAGREVTSGPDGSYLLNRLAGGSYTFVATREGFEEDRRTFTVVSDATARLDFTLRPANEQGGIVAGVVTQNGNGGPLEGARVVLSSGVGSTPRVQTTGANGAFRFVGLPTDTYSLQVSRAGFVTQLRRGISVREGRVTNVNFTLRVRRSELASLEGTVTDESGRRINNAVVTLTRGASAGASDRTSFSGFYRITGIVTDTYELEATAPDFQTRVVSGVTVAPGRRTTLNITLARQGPSTALIEGIVVDTFGDVVPGARVEITQGPAAGRFDVTDVSGAYQIRGLPAGNHTLRTFAAGFDSAIQAVVLQVGEQRRVDFTLESNTGELSGAIAGRVTRADGTGVAGVTVRVVEGPIIGAEVVTDSDGDYVVRNLAAGTYTLEFTKTGFRDRRVTSIDVFEGRTTAVDVELQPTTGPGAGTLTGVVRDDAGVVLEGVLVEVREGGTVVNSTETDDQGRYSITGLRAGTYSVRFSLAGFRSQTVFNVNITENGVRELNVRLDAEAGETGRITGLVRDEAGRAVQNAQVELSGPSGSRTASTNGEGRFELNDVPVGSDYRVTVSAPGLESASQGSITVSAGGTVDLSFTLRPETGTSGIAGTVFARSGISISGATVRIVRGPVAGATRTTSRTGQFNFTGLPSGVYTLEARAPGFAVVRKEVVVREGNASTVNFFLPVR
jgi:protocatechuate 3,4-dioxygenase beta subunit